MTVTDIDKERVQQSVAHLFSIRWDKTCPDCGRKMMRIHRKWWHRVISKIIPMTRWECCGEKWLVIEDTTED